MDHNAKTTQHIKNFAQDKFNDNHTWIEQVIARWEKCKENFTQAVYGETEYAEFAGAYGPKMLVISIIRQWEEYRAINQL